MVFGAEAMLRMAQNLCNLVLLRKLVVRRVVQIQISKEAKLQPIVHFLSLSYLHVCLGLSDKNGLLHYRGFKVLTLTFKTMFSQE